MMATNENKIKLVIEISEEAYNIAQQRNNGILSWAELLIKNGTPLEQEPTIKNDLAVDCISRVDAIHAVSEALKHTFVEYEDIANKVIGKLPLVTPQKPRCKDCKWWKDSDGVYRRGIEAEKENLCPINTHTVYCGEGYCYMFSPKVDMKEVEE